MQPTDQNVLSQYHNSTKNNEDGRLDVNGSVKNSTHAHEEPGSRKRKGGSVSSQANSPAAHLESSEEHTTRMHKQIMKR